MYWYVPFCRVKEQFKGPTRWLIYGRPEKTKNCVKEVPPMPPINKIPYQILNLFALFYLRSDSTTVSLADAKLRSPSDAFE